MLDLSDLPDELQDGQAEPRLDDADLQAQQAQDYAKLQEIGKLIAGKRDAAKKARKESGIEDVWTACEEAYARIDELNRSDSGEQAWRKPTSINGPLTKDASKAAESRSTVFVPLTTRYVDMAAAKVKEKALPIGGKPFEIKPSPEPDLVDVAQGPPAAAPQVTAPQPAAPQPGQPPAPGQPAGQPAGQPPAQLSPQAAAAKQAMAAAATSAEKASNRIWDWLERSKYDKHLRKVIDDAARIGCGVLKGPFPEGAMEKALSQKDGRTVLEIVRETYPGCAWVNPWNFFPAGNCGEDIRDGDHVFELQMLSEGKLQKLKSLRGLENEPVYLPEQIDKVIEEGPNKANYDDQGRRKQDAKHDGMYPVWIFTGQVTREDMIALKAVGATDLPSELVYCHAVIELVNDTVIRAQFNMLEESGNYPYRVFNWSRRVGHWAGVGPGEQVAVPQRMVNAGVRAWMNNAGVSSGVQLILDNSKLEPMDGSWVVGGGVKLWGTTADGTDKDVRTLMAAIQIPNLGQELKAIVDFAFQMAEEMSNIPLVSQGRDGPTSPQTFGQAELQNTNGESLLRSVADTLDEQIEALVDDFYEWLLLDDTVPDDEKGDFQIIAQGCKAMVEKSIQEMKLMGMLNLSLNPAFGWNPEKVADMVARSSRIDPQQIALTDEEKQQRASQPPPDAPVVAAAKVNAAVKIHTQDMADQTQLKLGAAKHDRETLYQDSLNERAQIDAKARSDELNVTWQIALLNYAKDMKISIQEAKTQLASVSMKGELQRELSTDALAVQLHTHHVPGASSLLPSPQAMTPLVEPAGRAPNGEAFAQ